MKSFRAAQRIDPGFDPDSVLLASVDPGLQGYDEARARGFHESLFIAAESLPGVVSAGFTDSAPIQLGTQQWGVETQGALLAYFARGLLFGTGTTEVTTYVVASLVIALSALLAGFLPARRAAGIDPMTALRYS